ncbi:hypothetical protein IJG04_00515 [Candidatus Saccharibacteria bacterium]|nr:hypothetical protein [Candidatus Saccharibacteria bacterium]
MGEKTGIFNSARDIPRDNINRGYGHLPPEAVEDWASHEADLSKMYYSGLIPGVSHSAKDSARKQTIMDRICTTLVQRSNFGEAEIMRRLNQIEKYLEDPGLLHNFEFFDIPSSDFMLQFYFAVWDRRIAEVMGYLHNYGKDLQGVVRNVPEDDIWYQMSYFEGMNINEREKAQKIVDFIKQHGIANATSFGGGNIPERLYGLPADLKLTVFDDGQVSQMKELFPDPRQRSNINYIHERLSEAPKHQELLGTQQLVWMHGVSMYLNEKERHEMTGAILCGTALLRPNGYMKYDYLVWTESMRRVISTQCWPYDPKNPMVIFSNTSEAIMQGRATLSAVNAKLAGKAYMDAMSPEVTLVEPWGVTSVRFTVQKHV